MKKSERTIYLDKHIEKIRKNWVDSNHPYKWEILDKMSDDYPNLKYFFELGYKKAQRDERKKK